MMNLDDLRNEHRHTVNKLNVFRFKREHFTYVTDKGVTKDIDTVSRIYENSGDHIATLSGYDAAPLRAAVRASVFYRGVELPATIQKRRDGDVDICFTPSFTE